MTSRTNKTASVSPVPVPVVAILLVLVTLLAVIASTSTTTTTFPVVEASYYTSKYYSSSSSSSGYNNNANNANNANAYNANGDDDAAYYDDDASSSSSSYNFDYSDDALAYTGSYNSYMRINNCISFVTQEPNKKKNNNNNNGGGGGVDISNSLPVKDVLWGVPTASFLFLHFDDGNSNNNGNGGGNYEGDYGDDAAYSGGGGGDSSTSSSTLLIDVKDAAFAFSATSYSSNNDDDAGAYYYDDDDVGVYDYSSASCQPLDVDLSYWLFGDILDTATSTSTSKSTDSSGGSLNFAYAQLYVGPICRPNMWGVAVGVFADADCSIYVPVLSDAMNGYGNNYGNGNNNNNEEEDGQDGNNNNVDVGEVSASIASAVQYINQAYQVEIGCGDNANTCASILEAASDFDTCSANSFFFGDVTPWSAFGSSGGRRKQHYQISQSQLSDSDSTCAAIATAIEDTSSPAYSDYLQTLASNGGMGQYTTDPNGGGSAASQAGRVWGVLFLVSLAVLTALVVMMCKCIRIRRVRNEATGRDVLTLDVLKGRGTWFSPPPSPTTSKTGAPTSPQQQQQDGGGDGGKDGLMKYITSAFAKQRSPRDGTVAGDDGGADYQKYDDDSPIGSPVTSADDSITRHRSTNPTKTMKIVKQQSASYDTDVDGGDAASGGGNNNNNNAVAVAAASTYESEVV